MTPGFGAVVLGGDYVGLGIVRSLGAHGVPVVVVDDERSIARFSRHTRHAVRLPSLDAGERTVNALLRLGDRLDLGGWILLPTRDEAVATISRNRSRLAERFRVPTPSWETFRWAWDKTLTYELARRLEVPVPRTWVPGGVEGLDAIDAPPPYVIKPALKPRFLHATGKKAWRVDRRERLAERFRAATEAANGEPIMVQELIPGFGERQFAFCSLFKDGSSLATMTARRVRQHPMDFGRASTFVETVELPELEATSERLLREIDFYGLVELEYKHDPRTGEYKLLDVNARHWGYHSLGAGAGVDFSYLLYADQAGLSLPGPGRARAGVTWMRALTDAPTAALEIRAGRLKPRKYLRELRRRDVEAVFSRADARPALAELAFLPYLAMKRGF